MPRVTEGGWNTWKFADLPFRGRTKSVKLPPARCPVPSESHTMTFWTPLRGNGCLSANRRLVPSRLSRPREAKQETVEFLWEASFLQFGTLFANKSRSNVARNYPKISHLTIRSTDHRGMHGGKGLWKRALAKGFGSGNLFCRTGKSITLHGATARNPKTSLTLLVRDCKL